MRSKAKRKQGHEGPVVEKEIEIATMDLEIAEQELEQYKAKHTPKSHPRYEHMVKLAADLDETLKELREKLKELQRERDEIKSEKDGDNKENQHLAPIRVDTPNTKL